MLIPSDRVPSHQLYRSLPLISPITTSGSTPEHPVSQPASLDAVVDALLAEVSDLRDEHRRLRLKIQHLQEDNSHARDTEARVRGELDAVKTRVAELSQNFTPTLSSNYRPGVRSHRTHLGSTPLTVTHVVRGIPPGILRLFR
jgi:hypothetical protein